ncbi:MAG: hypothetical protein HRU19_13040 [Pseudobacteriovorax sp.]|nr:hypothetical protein [Pseudobacteriovorax sp.]
MAYRVLATLDLKNKTPNDKRDKFYELLREEKWAKIGGLTTAWRCKFSEDVDFEGALKTAQNDFKKAAKAAKLSDKDWKAAFMIGPKQPTVVP